MTKQEQQQINALKRQLDLVVADVADIKRHLDVVPTIQEELSKMTEAINNIPKVYIPRTWASTFASVAKWLIATTIAILGLIFYHLKK